MYAGKHIDILDDGDLWIQGEWEREGNVWYADAVAIVMGDLAEAVKVPHGTVVRGTFWVSCDDPDGHPETDSWEAWGLEDDFAVLEISPSLVDDLANAVSDVLDEEGLTPEDLADPGTASMVWETAWALLKEGFYGLNWTGDALDKTLGGKVTSGDVEELAYRKLLPPEKRVEEEPPGSTP